MAEAENEIITQLPEEFIREFMDEISGTIPAEKVQVELRQARNARIMKEAGSVNVEGLGQKKCEIDARLWFRLMHSFGHEENWLDDFLADNMELCAPGYKPHSSATRHGKTFINGAPV